MNLHETEGLRAHLLVYDIPTTTKMLNPSGMLWGLGARLNKSVWIILDKNVVRIPVAEWRAKGCTVELVRFDEREYDTLMRLARESLERHLEEIRNAVEVGMEKALHKLGDIATGDEAAMKKGKQATQVVTWRAKRDIARAQECALTFDLTADFAHLFEAVRHTVAANEKVAYEAVQKKMTAGQRELEAAS